MEHLKLKGNAKSRGEIHGESLKTQIHELYEIRNSLINKFFDKLSASEKDRIYSTQVEALKKFPELFQEFEAIAKSADISQNALMVLNNYTDMRDFVLANPTDEGCSLFYLKNSQGTSIGQTWDMHASATPYVVHLEIEEEQKPKMNIVTVAGCLALAGVNSFGVTVLINNMHCKQTNPQGIMWPGIVRLMLSEAESAKEALNIIQNNLPSSGHNYLIGDVKEGFNLETTGTQSLVSSHIKEEGYSFHTNHYVSELKKFESMERQSKSTHPRYEALVQLFRGEDWKNWDYSSICQKVFVEKAAETLCIAPTLNEPHKAATCGGIAFNASNNKGCIFKGLFAEKQHNNFEF